MQHNRYIIINLGVEKDYEKKMVRHCDLRRRIIGSRMFLRYGCVKGRGCCLLYTSDAADE